MEGVEGRESVTQEGGRRGWRGVEGRECNPGRGKKGMELEGRESVTQEGGRRGWKGERV